MKELTQEEIEDIRKSINNWTDWKWEWISGNRELPEDFIREFQDRLNWHQISIYQNLSEDFIREFKDKVKWHHVCIYQDISKEFCFEFYDKIDWKNLNACGNFYKGFFDDASREVKLYLLLNHRELSEYL